MPKINWMSRDEILRWSRNYDNDPEMTEDNETEINLGAKIRRTETVSQNDLLELVRWKFRFLPGRERRVKKYVKRNSDTQIAECFQAALREPNERRRFEILDDLWGIGPAMVSVILTFYDPRRYGVLDIHGWDELIGGNRPNNLFNGPTRLIEYLQGLRLIAEEYMLPVRQVEKAYFYRNANPAIN